MLKVSAIKLASSVLVDGSAETFLDTSKASFKHISELGAWEITGKKYGKKTIVYPTNIQWMSLSEIPDDEATVSTRSRQRTS
jgi:hypothetical protein